MTQHTAAQGGATETGLTSMPDPGSIEHATPMMRQYLEVKAKYPDNMVFFRMGDFYQLFYDDAREGSKLLDLTLTRRGKSQGTDIPMAGVPFHSIDGYLAKLVKLGLSAVICDQVGEISSKPGQNTLMTREISKIITPGTTTEDGIAPEKSDNCVGCIYHDRKHSGYYAYATISLGTGEFKVSIAGSLPQIKLYVEKHPPAELCYNEEDQRIAGCFDTVCKKRLPHWSFDLKTCYENLCAQFKTSSLFGFDLENQEEGIIAAGALLEYVKSTQRVNLNHIVSIAREENSRTVILDATAKRNLELLSSLKGQRYGSLLSVLDQTCTPMGSRLLVQYISEPLRDNNELEQRYNLIGDLIKSSASDELGDILRSIGDTQRSLVRISLRSARPKDLCVLRETLAQLPAIKELLSRQFELEYLCGYANGLQPFESLHELLERAVAPVPSGMLRDGGVIADGYSEQLDELRSLMNGAGKILEDIEQRERERTGISGLKVAFNSVHGYYIEVSKANESKVPPDYIRRQTLKNYERYITEELKVLEDKTLSARDQALAMERQIFEQLLDAINGSINELMAMCALLAKLDVMLCFANNAKDRSYVRPELGDSPNIIIKEGRHPVIESISDHPFVSNSVDFSGRRVFIISGPNMGGKSTFMRQTALIALMARIGSYVPASYAMIGDIDRVFTRIGASDDLASGRSTFMVEMEETASILNNATSQSLVLMDEIGRGTSTIEGMAIARSVVEFLCTNSRPLTLFATHYHEIPLLEKTYDTIENICFKAAEHQHEIVFLYHAEKGYQNYSYAIEVGRLAGLPQSVIDRARLNLREAPKTGNGAGTELPPMQADTLEDRKNAIQLEALRGLADKIKGLDVNSTSPINALILLQQLKDEAARIAKSGP